MNEIRVIRLVWGETGEIEVININNGRFTTNNVFAFAKQMQQQLIQQCIPQWCNWCKHVTSECGEIGVTIRREIKLAHV